MARIAKGLDANFFDHCWVVKQTDRFGRQRYVGPYLTKPKRDRRYKEEVMYFKMNLDIDPTITDNIMEL